MKKLISVILVIFLSLIFFVACGESIEAKLEVKEPVSNVEINQTYSIKFDGGVEAVGLMPSVTLQEGESFVVPENQFSKSGKTFLYFWTGFENIKSGDVFKMPSYDITFTAQWEDVSTKFNKSSGGSSHSKQSLSLSPPQIVYTLGGTFFSWEDVENAEYYTISIGGNEIDKKFHKTDKINLLTSLSVEAVVTAHNCSNTSQTKFQFSPINQSNVIVENEDIYVHQSFNADNFNLKSDGDLNIYATDSHSKINIADNLRIQGEHKTQEVEVFANSLNLNVSDNSYVSNEPLQIEKEIIVEKGHLIVSDFTCAPSVVAYPIDENVCITIDKKDDSLVVPKISTSEQAKGMVYVNLNSDLSTQIIGQKDNNSAMTKVDINCKDKTAWVQLDGQIQSLKINSNAKIENFSTIPDGGVSFSNNVKQVELMSTTSLKLQNSSKSSAENDITLLINKDKVSIDPKDKNIKVVDCATVIITPILKSQGKIYDGTTNVVVENIDIKDNANNENAEDFYDFIVLSANTLSENVGKNQLVNCEISYKNKANAIADNTQFENIYVIVENVYVDVLPRPISINKVDIVKTYDGKQEVYFDATLNVNDIIENDDVQLNFNDGKRVCASFEANTFGENVPITMHEDNLKGKDSSNYKLTFENGQSQSTAKICKRELEIEVNLIQKEYDSTVNIRTCDINISKLQNKIEKDDISVKIDKAYYNDANAGSDKTATVQFILEGADANGYVLNDIILENQTISKRKISLKANDQTIIYGQTLKDNLGYTITNGELLESNDCGEIFATVAVKSILDVGEYEIVLDYDKNENYEVYAKNGVLIVKPNDIVDKTTTYSEKYLAKEQSPNTICGETINGQALSYQFKTTKEGEYTSTIPSFTDVGEYVVYYKISAKNHNTIENSMSVSITQADFDMEEVKWESDDNFVYDGAVKSITLTGLPQGLTATYNDNIATNAGNYKATVTFEYDTKNYNPPIFAKSKEWKIKQKSIADKSIIMSEISDQIYTGEEIFPNFTIYDQNINCEVELISSFTDENNCDYFVYFEENIDESIFGNARIVIVGNKNYNGLKIVEFKIIKDNA